MNKPPLKTIALRNGETEQKYRAPALEKGLDVLELLAHSSEPMTTSQIAAELGRSVSELFRMILTLEHRGYIALADNGSDGYLLSNQLFALGIARAPTRTLLELAMPTMAELARDIGQSCHLAILSGEQTVVIGRIENPSDLGFSVRVGYRRPIAHSAAGLVVYSFQEADTQRTLRNRFDIEGAELREFLQRAAEVRERGYVQLPSDFIEGVTDVSTPVRSERGVVAALTVPFVRSRPERCTIEQATDRLCKATAELSNRLRWHSITSE